MNNSSQLSIDNSKLPTNLAIIKLGDLFDIKSSKRVHKKDWKEKGIPFYRAREVVKLAENGFVDNNLFISNELYEAYTKDKGAPRVGDIIISAVGTLGRCYVVKNEDKFYFKDASVLWFEKKSETDSRYIDYAFKSEMLLKQVMDKSMGATVGTLTISRAKNIELPIPPLPEQKRIVKILDQAFAAIDKAKENAEKNLQNTKELFESYLQDVFRNNIWEKEKIRNIATVTGGYSFKSKDFKKEGKYQVIRMGNVRPGVIRENESPVFLDELDEKVLHRALLKKNDVIITQTGTKKKRDYGFTVIIEKDNLLLNQRISSIRFIKQYLPEFFLYYSWTNLFKDQYFANETGTVGQGNVGIKAISEALIPFPEIEIQQKLVNIIKSFSSETKKLEAIYLKQIADLDELKKSILQKAFSGQLTGE